MQDKIEFKKMYLYVF